MCLGIGDPSGDLSQGFRDKEGTSPDRVSVTSSGAFRETGAKGLSEWWSLFLRPVPAGATEENRDPVPLRSSQVWGGGERKPCYSAIQGVREEKACPGRCGSPRERERDECPLGKDIPKQYGEKDFLEEMASNLGFKE